MDYGRRVRFVLQVSFLIGKGMWDLAKNRAAEIEQAAAMARTAR